MFFIAFGYGFGNGRDFKPHSVGACVSSSVALNISARFGEDDNVLVARFKISLSRLVS